MLKDVALAIAGWFRERAVPYFFRVQKDPYQIWVLEVMAQQTQLARAIAYLERWLERFPDIVALANAKEQEVLKLWEGLGYYSRARNLRKAAGVILSQYGGVFPACYKDILQLPGVGPYTAAIIASVVYGESEPAIDANVRRVFSRLFAKKVDIFSSGYTRFCGDMLRDMFQYDYPGPINEGWMELGEQICLKAQPKCDLCPLVNYCQAYAQQVVDQLPIIVKKSARIQEEYAVCYMHDSKGRFLAYREESEKLWRGLWLLPKLKMRSSHKKDITSLVEGPFAVTVQEVLPAVRHAYTKYKLRFYPVVCAIEEVQALEGFVWVDRHALAEYAFPSGMLKVLKAVFASLGE